MRRNVNNRRNVNSRREINSSRNGNKSDILVPTRIPETSTAAGPTAAQERTGTPGNADNSKVETPVEGMLTTVGTPATAGIPITAKTITTPRAHERQRKHYHQQQQSQ
jgi:hypothetical protein